ncbi:MAG: hypothetical protein M0036_26275 [Desulfobacteraceae bacterium]|nr:hypothetical protein [Desulfobacteraceae bacterium]
MKKVAFIILGFCISMTMIVLLSCGGGGGGESGGGGGGGDGGGGPTFPSFQPADLSQKMTVDQSHMVKATGVAFVAHQVGGIAGSNTLSAMGQEGGRPDAAEASILIGSISRFLAQQMDMSGDYAAAGSLSEPLNCPNGGSASASLQWTDINVPAGCGQIENLNGILSFSGCTDADGVFMDGTVNVYYNGAFCQPAALTNTFTNFTIRNGDDQMQTAQLRVNATNLTWSGVLPSPYALITAGHFVMNGQAIATLQGQIAALAFSDYVEDVSPNTLQVSGNLYGPCLGGWVTLFTPAPISLGDNDECPTAGRIDVTGDGGVSMAVIFNADGISINGTDIGSCNDMNLSCPP